MNNILYIHIICYDNLMIMLVYTIIILISVVKQILKCIVNSHNNNTFVLLIGKHCVIFILNNF